MTSDKLARFRELHEQMLQALAEVNLLGDRQMEIIKEVKDVPPTERRRVMAKGDEIALAMDRLQERIRELSEMLDAEMARCKAAYEKDRDGEP